MANVNKNNMSFRRKLNCFLKRKDFFLVIDLKLNNFQKIFLILLGIVNFFCIVINCELSNYKSLNVNSHLLFNKTKDKSFHFSKQTNNRIYRTINNTSNQLPSSLINSSLESKSKILKNLSSLDEINDSISTYKNIMNNLVLPIPSKLQQLQNDCPNIPKLIEQQPSKLNNLTIKTNTSSFCTCYAFDDGVYIECDNSVPIQIIKLTLFYLKGRSVKSFTVYHLNDTIDNLISDNYSSSNLITIERLQISYGTMKNLSQTSFKDLDTTLKSLAITNSKLQTIPQNSLKQLKRLETLDLDANQIDQIDSYAFYGLPLIVLNLQSNRLYNLLEYSFGGLEHTLEELILMHNSLVTFPLVALRRLRKLKTLKLSGNLIKELMDDGFTRFTALQNLDLSNNKLTILNERSLITMPKLITLSLASNCLVSFSESPFIYLLELETLDLSHNFLRSINSQVFTNLGNLKTLDLSANHLHSLPNTVLHPLANLRELYLSKNNLLKLSNQTFSNNTMMQALFISHNAISEIEIGVFNNLKTMQQLHLSFNQIRDIQVNLLKNNLRLKTLALDNNLIANLQAGCFQELVELRDLRLQRNLLKLVQRGVFYSFPSLQELDLEYNRIEQLEPQALQSLVNLQYLNLQGNRLIEIGDFVLSSLPSSLKHIQLNYNQILNIHNGGLKGQTNLEVIWINFNKLQKLSVGIFNDLRNCEKLYLQNNELATIESGVFQNMENLIYLNLENNNLAQLSIDIFKGAKKLSELYLSNNHIMDIEAFAFSNLPSLRLLSLDNNQIYVLRKDVFSRTDQYTDSYLPIEKLSMTSIMVEEIESDIFKNLKDLKILDLGDNNLNLEKLNFNSLQKINDLNLKRNNLTFSADDLCKLKNLEQLDLTNTNLSLDFLSKIFNCFNKLKKLVINENDLESFVINYSENFNQNNKTKNINKIEFALEQFYLERNHLSTIPNSNVLKIFKGLKQLSLAGNSIKRIFKNELHFNNELKILNLSSNGLSVIDAQSFVNLTSLITLDLSNNVMRSLPENAFDGLTNLEELFLNNNWFQHIPNNLFISNLISLRILNFNFNPLQRIREDLSVIGGFQLLTTLNLVNCSLSIIASHDFYGLPQLTTLNLKNNNIIKISPGSFRLLEKLTTLDLTDNDLEILPEERLTSLNELITLNLTGNHLLEMPAFSKDLKKLRNLDLSRNRLTRVDTFGNLGNSIENLNLKSNMITWLENSAFQNFSSLKILDLSKNHLTHFSDQVLSKIEVTLEQLFISGNPFHCDCRLLSLYEWLQEHSRLVIDENDLHCIQPEKLSEQNVLSVHPVDFCPIPLISSLEVIKVEFNFISIKWDVQNNSLVGGFTLNYHQAEERFPLAVNRQLSVNERMIDIINLNPTTLYTICIQANGKYLRSFTNKAIPYVVDHHKTYFNDYVTNNQKCIQAKTLDFSKRTPIQITTFSLMVIAGTISGVFLMCILVLIIGIKYRRRRTCDSSESQQEIKNSNELPEEYITYRHFSLPSTENVYS